MLKINNKKLKGFLLLLLGIATAVCAQMVLLYSRHGNLSTYFSVKLWLANSLNNTSPLPGVFLYALAGIIFILGLRSFDDSFSSLQIDVTNHLRARPRFGFWATSLIISAVIAVYATQAGQNDAYGYVFTVLWVFAIALLVISVLLDTNWRHASIDTSLAWLKKHRAELLVIAFIVALAFLIRFADVELHPYSFNNDEGQMGSGGACIVRGECANFFSLGWADQARLAFFPYAVSIALLGKTALAVRLVSVITGTLSVLAVYLFAREVFDKKVAWLSAILLSILPLHIHFSRTGVDNIVDALTAPLILWLVFRGAKRGSSLSLTAAGLVTGLCMYTYPGSLLAAGLGIGTLGYIAVRTRGFLRTHIKALVVFILAIVIVLLPILGYYSANSVYFLSRFKRESILQDAGIPAQSQATGLNAAEILTTQFAKSSLVYLVSNAPGNFFNSPRAYLSVVEAIIFMLGMLCVLWHIKDIRYTVVFIWFWAVVILGSTLTGGPPTSQRLLMSTPALSIIVALGMINILAAFKQFYQPMARFAPIALLSFLFYAGYTNLSYYFSEYRIGHYYEDTTNELPYEAGRFVSPLHEQGAMYLIANPEDPYLSFESFHYFSPDVDKYDFQNITREQLFRFPKDKDILFVALPGYESNLELISRWVPGGKWTEFPRRYQSEQILFYSYKISKEQLAVLNP